MRPNEMHCDQYSHQAIVYNIVVILACCYMRSVPTTYDTEVIVYTQ